MNTLLFNDHRPRIQTLEEVNYYNCLMYLNSIDKQYKVSDSQSVYEQFIERHDEDNRVWGELQRSSFANELTIIYSELNKKFNLSGRKILEIGTGILTNGKSHLSSSFPNSHFVFSDRENITAKYSQMKGRYQTIDLSKTVSKTHETFEVVMGSNVLDTLPYRKLSNSFQLISKHLMPEGRFVHIANLNFYANAFTDACTNYRPNSNLLPFFSEKMNFEKMFAIDKIKMVEILREKLNELKPGEYDFFMKWDQKHPQVQSQAVVNILAAEVIQNPQAFHMRLKELFSNSLEEISSVDLFEDYMKKAAEENDFEVEECGYRQASLKYPKTVFPNFLTDFPKINHLILKNGMLDFEGLDKNFLDPQREPLAKTQGIKTAYVHVFVCKKKEAVFYGSENKSDT